MKSVFVSIGILILICTGGFFLYEVAYSQGETSGYIDGYDQGYAIGKEGGYSSGEAEGYHQGEQAGYDEGYFAGKADGYTEGVKAGLGHGYTLKDPTYKQAVKFLQEDETNKNEFLENSYICSHFARDVCNSAEGKGFRSAYVGLIYPKGGHAIIAFNTIDKGLVYFDPQTDDEVIPVIGKRYYECIVPKSGHYYEKPYQDDTMIDILVVW